MRAPPQVHQALNQTDSFETRIVKQLEAFMLERIPGEEVLKEESARFLWNPVFNASVESTEKPDWFNRVSRYTSMNRLLTSYLEKSQNTLNFARRRTSLDIWVGPLEASLGLDIFDGDNLYLSITCGLYLSTTCGLYLFNGQNCPDQTGYNDFEVLEGKSPGFLIVFSGSKEISLLVCAA